MAEHAALKEGIRASVAIFSLEMPAEQILTRMLSSVGSVHLGNIRSGKLSEDDWPRITGATKQLQDAKIFIDDTPALTPTELRARSRRIKREHGLDLIVVDYLQLMSVPGTKENRATEISEISRGLKALAKELQLPGDRPVAAESRRGTAREQEAGDVGPARIRRHRAGCGHDPADLPRRGLQQGHAEEGRRRNRPRQAS